MVSYLKPAQLVQQKLFEPRFLALLHCEFEQIEDA
ncbi:Uncharacterised protein [Acinetobacter baumannii]|nr:Uncharacterised protein [Acinetobacter baumannii]